MKNRAFRSRLAFALRGLAVAWRQGGSFRVHIVFLALALAALLAFRPEPLWWAVFALAAATVISAELFNGAIETLADVAHPEMSDKVRDLKDMAAAAVLVPAIASLAIALALLVAVYRN